DVAIHGFEGSDFAQRFEHRGSSHIAGVQNQLDAGKRPGDIGSHEAMRIRDEADDDLLHAWPGAAPAARYSNTARRRAIQYPVPSTLWRRSEEHTSELQSRSDLV